MCQHRRRCCSSALLLLLLLSWAQIVMEYCSAGSVSDLMTICDTLLQENQIAHICASVLLGFQYLHASRHIHRVGTRGQGWCESD